MEPERGRTTGQVRQKEKEENAGSNQKVAMEGVTDNLRWDSVLSEQCNLILYAQCTGNRICYFNITYVVQGDGLMIPKHEIVSNLKAFLTK